jgi:hypothetical protein
MDVTTLLITVYCAIDEGLAGRRLRQRATLTAYRDYAALAGADVPRVTRDLAYSPSSFLVQA